MNKIRQTILSIDDIAEHHDFLLKLPNGEFGNDGRSGWIISYDISPKAIDDMLVRFAKTFLESYDNIPDTK